MCGSCNPCCPISSAVENVVSVGDTQREIVAADPTRRDLIIQSQEEAGGEVVQIYLTPALGFGNGGILLYPGEIWRASQVVGLWTGAVYGICSTGENVIVSYTQEF